MRPLLLTLGALLLGGCSHDTLQRSGYEMLRNMEQNRCRAEGVGDCAPIQDYDDYQQQRRELEEAR